MSDTVDNLQEIHNFELWKRQKMDEGIFQNIKQKVQGISNWIQADQVRPKISGNLRGTIKSTLLGDGKKETGLISNPTLRAAAQALGTHIANKQRQWFAEYDSEKGLSGLARSQMTSSPSFKRSGSELTGKYETRNNSPQSKARDLPSEYVRKIPETRPINRTAAIIRTSAMERIKRDAENAENAEMASRLKQPKQPKQPKPGKTEAEYSADLLRAQKDLEIAKTRAATRDLKDAERLDREKRSASKKPKSTPPPVL